MQSSSIRTSIQSYLATGNLEAIISLCESLRDQRDRAELRREGLLHEIKRLAQAFANITEPKTGRPITDSRQRAPHSPNTGVIDL